MIKCSILKEKYSHDVRVILHKAVMERLVEIFESEFSFTYPYEKNLDLDIIKHLFPDSFIRYKSDKEIKNTILKIKNILTDNIIREQLSSLHLYVLYLLDINFFESQKEMIDLGEMNEEESIPKSIRNLFSANNELTQDDKGEIKFWFTDGLYNDLYENYDCWNMDDLVFFGWNDFANIAQSLLRTNEIEREHLDMLMEGLDFVPKDISELCLKKIETKDFILLEDDQILLEDNQTEASKDYKTDFFISYASEEKAIAIDLAEELRLRGATVWIDKSDIKIGDPIKPTIEKGMQNSEYAIVILSENYFKKYWTNNELNALFELEENGNKKILPLVYNLSHAQLKSKSILLANKSNLTLDEENVPSVAKKIMLDIYAIPSKHKSTH